MRFHFGMSFRPSKLLKYIALGFFGLLAFMGIYKANASTLGYTSIQVNNSNNQSVMYCDSNTSKTCPANFPLGGYQELIGRTFLINFDNTTLTNNHDYTFAIEFLIAHDSSDTAFEQESFLIYQVGSSGALNDTTITWSYSTTYDWEQDYYITSYIYQGQFKATSTSTFYASLKMENNESFYGVAIGNISLTDDSLNEEIINANYQNTQNIINNQNSNANSIINNQDNNTQEIIDNQNELLGDKCQNLIGLDTNKYQVNLSANDKIVVVNNTSSVLTLNMYNTMSSSSRNDYWTIGSNSVRVITIANNTGAIAWSSAPSGRAYAFEGSMYRPYCEYGSFISKLDNVSNSIDDLNDTITDETLPDIDDSTFGDLEISSDSAISDLITMPITILQALNNNLGNTCSPYTIPFGLTGGSQTLTFPCIHPEEYLGSTIWNYIDLFICFFMIYNIAMLIISSFESITSLEDTFNSLYEPRHADTGYKPKHGGD